MGHEQKVRLSLSGVNLNRPGLVKLACDTAKVETETTSTQQPRTPTPKHIVIEQETGKPKFLQRALDLNRKSLQERIAEMPPPPSASDYLKMPPENYGKALLEGLGWVEGEPLHPNGPTRAWESLGCPQGLGQASAEVKKKKDTVHEHDKGYTLRDDARIPIGAVFSVNKKLIEITQIDPLKGKHLDVNPVSGTIELTRELLRTVAFLEKPVVLLYDTELCVGRYVSGSKEKCIIFFEDSMRATTCSESDFTLLNAL